VIFSNILITKEDAPYWSGKDADMPEGGINYLGEWTTAMQDAPEKPVPPSHPNARFTLALADLENVDPQLESPEGVPIRGIIYGGRDSNTWVPVEQSFDWIHGIVTKGAALESETTAATLGKEGVRKLNPMSNLDFLSIPIGRYIQDNIDFGRNLAAAPLIFSVNYFLRDESGAYTNAIVDKRVWLKWMELRIHGEVKALKTPTGFIPCYEDLRGLFESLLNKDYPYEDYRFQFTTRVRENLAKIERVLTVYTEVPDTPPVLFTALEQQKQRLLALESELGTYVPPESFTAS
jgi:phosphoenolpyruvate carboxykinase (GTP)